MLRLILLAALLGLLGATPAAQARTIVDVQPYHSYVCTVTYDDGFREIAFCPMEWPYAHQTVGVVCLCEHVSSQYGDACEVMTTQYNQGYSYRYERVGSATFTYPPDPSQPNVAFSCPYGQPGNAMTCTVKVTAIAPSGATGTTKCKSF